MPLQSCELRQHLACLQCIWHAGLCFLSRCWPMTPVAQSMWRTIIDMCQRCLPRLPDLVPQIASPGLAGHKHRNALLVGMEQQSPNLKRTGL